MRDIRRDQPAVAARPERRQLVRGGTRRGARPQRLVDELRGVARHLGGQRGGVAQQSLGARRVALRACRPALRAGDVGHLARERLAAGERRAEALERRGHGGVVAREVVDADVQRAHVDQRAERVLLLEVQLGLREPARRVVVAAGQEADVAEAERRVAGRLVVVGPDGLAERLRHVGLQRRPVLARLERQQAPEAERERVAVAAQRHGRADAAREREGLAGPPDEEQRQGEPLLGHAARLGVEPRLGQHLRQRVGRAAEAVGHRGVGDAQRRQPPRPSGRVSGSSGRHYTGSSCCHCSGSTCPGSPCGSCRIHPGFGQARRPSCSQGRDSGSGTSRWPGSASRWSPSGQQPVCYVPGHAPGPWWRRRPSAASG